MKNKFELWLGDEGSYSAYEEVLAAMRDPDLLTKKRDDTEPDDGGILDMYGSTAVINITGELLPFSNWITRMLGRVGYPDIRQALVTAAEDERVKNILMHIDSPGGAAKGIEDISQLISKVKLTKNVVAYSNGTMASAAYWIGASADKIYGSRMANIGSIGVITLHADVTKSLEQDGIKVTVFRAGEFKALGGPYESLSTRTKNIIQGRLDSMYNEFINHVAVSRKTTPQNVIDNMAEGREFFGHEALKNGLIDGIMSIDDLMSGLQNKSETVTARMEAGPAVELSTNHTRMEASEMPKKILTQQAAAALAAGVPADVALQALEDAPEGSVPAVEPAASSDPEPEPEPESAPEPAAASAVSEDPALVSFLKEQLSAANEKAMQLTIANRDLQAKVDSMSATHEQFRVIVADTTNTKRIALGGSSSDLSTLSDEGLLQSHAQASADFNKVYPVGGKAQLPSTEPPAAPVTHIHQARLGAVRPATKG